MKKTGKIMNCNYKIFIFTLMFFGLSNINKLNAQAGLPCEQYLYIEGTTWNEDNVNGTIYLPASICPGCDITYTYKWRYYTQGSETKVDIIVTGFTLSNACNNCNINVFEYILWGIWMENGSTWGLTSGSCLDNRRISAASCWTTNVGTRVEYTPCNSTCCVQYYSVCKNSFGKVFFDVTDPLPVTSNCINVPCTYFVCDKLASINITEAEADELEEVNFPIGGKMSPNINSNHRQISIEPNPVKEQLILSFENNLNAPFVIKIINNYGDIMYKSGEITNKNSYKTSISLKDMFVGTYLVFVEQDGFVVASTKFNLIK